MHGKCSITNGANIIKFIAVHISRIRQESLKIADGKQSEEAQTHMKPNIYEKAQGNTYLDTAGMLTTKGKLKKTHYHWKNQDSKKLSKKQGENVYYFDKYGNTCKRGSDESHIKPFRTKRIKK
jgi:hypothetical protein